ncbi:Uncharacterized protein ChrSV_2893 [Chromobacterium vaccinii]|nr:Uncharacterized protein ChrSW_2893 [Chromobacterium vaccinii]QND90350.1 Uncharacterized protein ChrSV_2893 [Chromobacterium vaccinii]
MFALRFPSNTNQCIYIVSFFTFFLQMIMQLFSSRIIDQFLIKTHCWFVHIFQLGVNDCPAGLGVVHRFHELSRLSWA